MKLYTFFRSSASYRVRIALNLKGLTYEQAPIHLRRGGVDEGGKRQAVFFDRQNIWIAGEIAAVATRVAELRHQADVGERRRVTEAIIAAL